MNIHPGSIVDPQAELGEDVHVGPFTIIHGKVRIGAGTRIGSHCEIGVPTALGDGTPLEIGAGGLIRSHSVFYQSSRFGPGLRTGHRVTVREHTQAGQDLQIGTLSDIQGDCQIGNHVRFHSNVHVGKRSEIGHFVRVYPYVVLTNDPTPPSETLIGCVLEDYSVVATMAVILPGVRIGRHALVGALACVGKDVPAGKVAVGVPAKIVADASQIKLRDGSGHPAYPWIRHFHRGYPEDVLQRWREGKDNF